MNSLQKPLIGLPCDTYEKDGLIFHSAGDKYMRAVADVAECTPVLVPSIGDSMDLTSLLDRLDGVVMTGATSNVHPPHFGDQPTADHEPYDIERDATSLILIRAVLDKAMPLLCICRGFQELNVVFGGALAAEIQRGEGKLDHRAPQSDELDVRYGPVHAISITPGGILEKILGKTETVVNTVHRQGVARLADGLSLEAAAPDGTVEAASVKDAAGFALGVQWHPEYKAAQNPDSVKLFEAFGRAARDYQGAAGSTTPSRSRMAS